MAILAQNTGVWTLRLLTALVGLGLVVGLEMFLRFMSGIGPAPLVKRAERGDTTLYSINREYSERFFSGQQGRLAAAGQMAERFFCRARAGKSLPRGLCRRLYRAGLSPSSSSGRRVLFRIDVAGCDAG